MKKNPRPNSNQLISSPSILLATWFGTGLLPMAPGSWGSIAALPFAWWIASKGGYAAMLIGVLLISAVGWWASEAYLRHIGGKDPEPIVIDEVAGQWLSVAFVPPDLALYTVGFLAFRFADILKPWPVGWADRRIAGGFGIMLDDLLAGLYGAAFLFAFQRIDLNHLFSG